jgi:3-dehydroquinate synthase
MIQPLTVRLGSRSYPIVIATGALDEAGPRIREAVGETARRAVVVTNPRVGSLFGVRVMRSLKRSGFAASSIAIGDGERFKTLDTAKSLFDLLIERRLERTDVLVALGGGVVGDLTGFVAATYLRGIRFAQVPTTLLAQIDSSVGGKTGVNHPLGKNLIGAFHQPSLVVIDPSTLATLPPREFTAGLCEAIKCGIIRDRRLFVRIRARLEEIKRLEPTEVGNLIRRCCAIKANVVRLDERESGLRRVLNFGHTAGHAIEAVTRYRRYLHGEAVGLGMIVESVIAERLGILAKGDRAEIEVLIQKAGLPKAPTLAPGDIIAAMARDKKTEAGRLTFVLPVRIGRVVIRSDVPPSILRSALNDALLSH